MQGTPGSIGEGDFGGPTETAWGEHRKLASPSQGWWKGRLVFILQ